MAEKEIFCAFAVDLDAVAGWLGSYGGRTTTLMNHLRLLVRSELLKHLPAARR
jgi:hypothetical protein